MKADLGLSVQQTNAITTGHTIQFAVPAHQYGHAQYGAWQEHVSLEQYNQNSNCVVYNDVYSDSYLDLGAGWNTWTSTS